MNIIGIILEGAEAEANAIAALLASSVVMPAAAEVEQAAGLHV